MVNVGRGHIKYSAERTIIHYDPKAPDKYYIGDEVENKRSSAVFAYAASGLMIVFAAFIILIAMRPQKQTPKQCIYFDTPYCRFLFVDRGDIGYEGEIEWNLNLAGEKRITAFFETDASAAAPRKQLRAIQPGKCYSRLEKILSDKERIDHDVKKLVADYFLFRPELIKENASEQELVDDMELSYIGVCRNGDTEFDLYSARNIYVEDLRCTDELGTVSYTLS